MRRANREDDIQPEKPLSHKLYSFTSSLCACSASSAAIKCIFSIYGLVCSKIGKSLDAEKPEKLVKIYRLRGAEGDNCNRIYSNYSIYSSLSFKPFKFRCYSFCMTKRKYK